MTAPPNTPEPALDIMDVIQNLHHENNALRDEITRLKSQIMTIREFNRVKIWSLHKALDQLQKRVRLESETEDGEVRNDRGETDR